MGAWGSGLYENDTTCDVRNFYMDLLRDQLSNQEAYDKTLEEFQECIGYDDDEPLLWFALAETQWKVGRLMPEVKAKALEWIEKGGGISLWEESTSGTAGWMKTLAKLKDKLGSPMRAEKRFMKLELNPWDTNDVYAYQFHKEVSKKSGLLGKYILIQKIGEFPYRERKKIHMEIHFIDHVFDELPSLEDVNKYRILPTDPLYHWESTRPFTMHTGIFLLGSREYPKKYLTHLGNIQGPPHKTIKPRFSMSWHDIEDRLIELRSVWRDKKYEVKEDGTYSYDRNQHYDRNRHDK